LVRVKINKIKIVAKIEKPILVNTDKQIIDIVVRNLIANAIRFCQKNDQLIINVENKTEHTLFFVIDTESGILSEDINKIFALDFFKGKKGKHTGYALTICMLSVS